MRLIYENHFEKENPMTSEELFTALKSRFIEVFVLFFGTSAAGAARLAWAEQSLFCA